MSFKLKIWRATIGRFFAGIDSAIEQRRIRESFNYPIIKRAGREALMYYENGRSTAITCDLALGCRDVDLLVYNTKPLKWRDSGELLTPEESEKVYSTLPDLLASKNIRWAYSETIHRKAVSS
jgi:hypothetical protein